VSAEFWLGEKWIPIQAKWWNDPEINWPVSPLGLFPNLPDALMFRVERRIIDELWPTSELPTNAENAIDHNGAPGGHHRHPIW
jgi:hypothetical protein